MHAHRKSDGGENREPVPFPISIASPSLTGKGGGETQDKTNKQTNTLPFHRLSDQDDKLGVTVQVTHQVRSYHSGMAQVTILRQLGPSPEVPHVRGRPVH